MSTNARNYQSQNSRYQFLTPLRLAWFIFALRLVAPSRVGAENRAGAFTLTPYFGGQGFPFGGDTHYDADYNYGLRAGYNFTPHWGTEFVFGLNRTVHDPEAEYCNIYQYGADVLYFFQPDKKVVPFFAAGFGVLDVKFYGAYDGTPPAGTQLNSDETNPYFNYGGGVEFQITSRLGFRADFRDAIMLNSGDHALQGGIGLRFQF